MMGEIIIMTQTKYENVFVEGVNVYRIINGEYHRLSQFVDNLGYYQTCFTINGKRKYVRVHRLIAETLIPNPNNLPMVNHIDGNKLNNNSSNLEWCDNSYNTQDGYNRGAYLSTNRCPLLVFDRDTQEEFIFRSIRECAESLHLNRKTISAILNGEKRFNNYPYDFIYMEECTDYPSMSVEE